LEGALGDLAGAPTRRLGLEGALGDLAGADLALADLA
jgi:hypothetical protein